MSKKATVNELSSLHGVLARTLIERIEKGEASPSEMSVARQLLKDNGIECDGQKNPDMQGLKQAAELPFTDPCEVDEQDDLVG